MEMDSIYTAVRSTYKVALLIKECDLIESKINNYYLDDLENKGGVSKDDVISFTLTYNKENKCPVSLIKSYLGKLLKSLDRLQVKTLFVCDGNYFKTITNSKKTAPHLGYVLPCAIKGYEHMNVVLGINYQALLYNPVMQGKLDMALETLSNQVAGVHIPLGTSVIHSEFYPQSANEVQAALDNLHRHDTLSCDVETFGLDFSTCGIGTISFAWSQHEGLAFLVDYEYSEGGWSIDTSSTLYYGRQKNNPLIKKMLYEFFLNYKGTLIYHNANFDIKILIYNLYMDSMALNQQGLLYGLETMTRSFEDTKIISYLATNATIGNNLSLKDLAHEFAGNYAQSDIKDIRLIDKDDLLRYNLIDCLSTWFVYNKHKNEIAATNQTDTYHGIMLPNIKVILQMELTGMPIDMREVETAHIELNRVRDVHESGVKHSAAVKEYNIQLQKEECLKKNLLLKVKVKPLEDFAHITFNPASTKHLQGIIYSFLGYDVIDTTDTGLPATGAKTIKKLLHLSKSDDHTQLFEHLIGLAEVSIIINTFIAALKNKSILKTDGNHYLHGNFNIGGTVSGRLSSSKPNLQNIPSTGSKYAKRIKQCFKAPEGWIFVGADFSSLEDRISALTTKDPNKIKVYTDGYDGHCLRAYSYFGDKMVGIGDTVHEINSISERYPALRQASKAPTFLLTYGGTSHGLINNVGLSKEDALQIEENYHDLYKVSDDWVKDKITQASIDGYVTLAFGLRLRTPTLARTLVDKQSTPYMAQGEARTAGNALGQSYGLLNSRAGIEFQQRVLNSPYAMHIKPTAQIHDSMYFIIKNTYGCLKWFNDNLIECMEWQGLPEIQHPVVKLGGNVELYYPNWNDKITLPNGASKSDIKKLVEER